MASVVGASASARPPDKGVYKCELCPQFSTPSLEKFEQHENGKKHQQKLNLSSIVVPVAVAATAASATSTVNTRNISHTNPRVVVVDSRAKNNENTHITNHRSISVATTVSAITSFTTSSTQPDPIARSADVASDCATSATSTTNAVSAIVDTDESGMIQSSATVLPNDVIHNNNNSNNNNNNIHTKNNACTSSSSSANSATSASHSSASLTSRSLSTTFSNDVVHNNNNSNNNNSNHTKNNAYTSSSSSANSAKSATSAPHTSAVTSASNISSNISSSTTSVFPAGISGYPNWFGPYNSYSAASRPFCLPSESEQEEPFWCVACSRTLQNFDIFEYHLATHQHMVCFIAANLQFVRGIKIALKMCHISESEINRALSSPSLSLDPRHDHFKRIVNPHTMPDIIDTVIEKVLSGIGNEYDNDYGNNIYNSNINNNINNNNNSNSNNNDNSNSIDNDDENNDGVGDLADEDLQESDYSGVDSTTYDE